MPALRRRTSAASWSPSAITWCWAAALSGCDWKLCQAAVNLLNRSGRAAVSELAPIRVWIRLRYSCCVLVRPLAEVKDSYWRRSDALIAA